MKIKTFLPSVLFFSGTLGIGAQDLLESLKADLQNTVQYELATFKGGRIGIGQSTETPKKGVLQLGAMSRFWNIPESTQGFVADRATVRIGAEYGFTDRLSVGLGGTTFSGIFDGFAKYQLVKQRTDDKGLPLNITLYQNATYRSMSYRGVTAEDGPNRSAFTSQLLISRKFTRNFSLQVSPVFIHRNFDVWPNDPENHFALGFGGRYKLGGHVSITSEYFVVTNPLNSMDTYGPFSLGVNWEVTDLLLQFQLTNARNIVEDAFISQTVNNFNTRDGNLHFGFSFTFTLHTQPRKLPKVN